MRIKAGSLQPPMSIQLLSDGTPIDITPYAPTMVAVQGAVEVIRDTSPAIADPTTGVVSHEWVGTETATAGRMFWTVEVDLGDGLVIFPAKGSEATDIE